MVNNLTLDYKEPQTGGSFILQLMQNKAVQCFGIRPGFGMMLSNIGV